MLTTTPRTPRSNTRSKSITRCTIRTWPISKSRPRESKRSNNSCRITMRRSMAATLLPRLEATHTTWSKPSMKKEGTSKSTIRRVCLRKSCRRNRNCWKMLWWLSNRRMLELLKRSCLAKTSRTRNGSRISNGQLWQSYRSASCILTTCSRTLSADSARRSERTLKSESIRNWKNCKRVSSSKK